ncbi:hypothetical protein [Mailhella sp.]
MSCRSEKVRDMMHQASRDRRQDKMESSARHKAWALMKDKIAEARANVAAARAALENEATPETRRRYLAARMNLEALKQRAAKTWT